MFNIIALLALGLAILIVLADKWADEEDKRNH